MRRPRSVGVAPMPAGSISAVGAAAPEPDRAASRSSTSRCSRRAAASTRPAANGGSRSIKAKGLDRSGGDQPLTYTAPELGSDIAARCRPPAIATKGRRRQLGDRAAPAGPQRNPNRGSRGNKRAGSRQAAARAASASAERPASAELQPGAAPAAVAAAPAAWRPRAPARRFDVAHSSATPSAGSLTRIERTLAAVQPVRRPGLRGALEVRAEAAADRGLSSAASCCSGRRPPAVSMSPTSSRRPQRPGSGSPARPRRPRSPDAGRGRRVRTAAAGRTAGERRGSGSSSSNGGSRGAGPVPASTTRAGGAGWDGLPVRRSGEPGGAAAHARLLFSSDSGPGRAAPGRA